MVACSRGVLPAGHVGCTVRKRPDHPALLTCPLSAAPSLHSYGAECRRHLQPGCYLGTLPFAWPNAASWQQGPAFQWEAHPAPTPVPHCDSSSQPFPPSLPPCAAVFSTHLLLDSSDDSPLACFAFPLLDQQRSTSIPPPCAPIVDASCWGHPGPSFDTDKGRGRRSGEEEGAPSKCGTWKWKGTRAAATPPACWVDGASWPANHSGRSEIGWAAAATHLNDLPPPPGAARPLARALRLAGGRDAGGSRPAACTAARTPAASGSTSAPGVWCGGVVAAWQPLPPQLHP